MNLWRLEWTRLVRTQRWLILLAVFASVGVLGPLTVRYLPEVMESLGEEAVGSIPEMAPPDAITQYMGNAVQIGILAVAFIAAAALAFDSRTEIAVFFRSRAPMRDIYLSRFVASSVASIVAFGIGMAVAYTTTGFMLEWLDLGPIVVGSLLFMLYLVFVVALIGLVASFLRSTPAVALLSIGLLIVVGVLSVVSTLAPWMPGALVGGIESLIRGGDFDYWRSIVATSAVIAVMVPYAIHRLEHREM